MLTQRTFKYRSGSAAVRALSEGTLYFASPKELNDCLEAKFDLAPAAAFTDIFRKTILELSSKRGSPVQWSETPANAAQFRTVHDVENKRFYASCQRAGIFSTSLRPDSQPMWAYYCSDARGFCFELHWTKELLEKYGLFPVDVTYTGESRVHNRADDFRELLLLHAKANPNWTTSDIHEYSLSEDFRRRWGILTTARALSIKHADWQHEQEVRIVAARSGPRAFLQDVLKRVIFMRTDFPEWGSVMMLLSRLYPDVEVAQLSFHHTEPFVRVQEMKRKLIPLEQIAQ